MSVCERTDHDIYHQEKGSAVKSEATDVALILLGFVSLIHVEDVAPDSLALSAVATVTLLVHVFAELLKGIELLAAAETEEIARIVACGRGEVLIKSSSGGELLVVILADVPLPP